MVVAFEEVESAQSRMFREVVGGHEISMAERRRPAGSGTFWCAADKPSVDDIALRPVYRTTRLPEDARCVECHIEIRTLQEMLA